MVILCTEYDAVQFLSSGGEIISGFRLVSHGLTTVWQKLHPQSDLRLPLLCSQSSAAAPRYSTQFEIKDINDANARHRISFSWPSRPNLRLY